jgi:hypothetical protein
MNDGSEKAPGWLFDFGDEIRSLSTGLCFPNPDYGSPLCTFFFGKFAKRSFFRRVLKRSLGYVGAGNLNGSLSFARVSNILDRIASESEFPTVTSR